MKYLLVLLALFTSGVADGKSKHPKKVAKTNSLVGTFALVRNEYRSSYGCGGTITKVLKGPKKTWYFINIKQCDNTFYKGPSHFELEELILIK